jgi:hypothetical protein
MRGRKRTVSHKKVIQYHLTYRDLTQDELAEHFHLSQGMISKILQACPEYDGIKRRTGRPPKHKNGQSALEYEWELKLHKEGLGMDSGLWINGNRIFYGEDALKEEKGDESVTNSESLLPM